MIYSQTNTFKISHHIIYMSEYEKLIDQSFTQLIASMTSNASEKENDHLPHREEIGHLPY